MFLRFASKLSHVKSVRRTCGDGEHEQAGEPPDSQEHALGDAAATGQHEQDEGTGRDLDQPEHKLGQVEVRPQPGHAQ